MESILFVNFRRVSLNGKKQGNLFMKTVFIAVFVLMSLGAGAQISYKHFLTIGQSELARENYLGAINNFNTALESNKDGFEAWFLRGIAKYSLGDYEGAVNDFSQTVKLHPLYTRAYLYRGICYDKIGNYLKALNDFDHALKLDPFDVDVYEARGETKINLHRYESAVDDFSAALQIKHNDPLLLLNRGVANHLSKNEKAALSDIDKSILLNGFNPDAYIKRGMIFYELDSLKKSLADFNKAISINDKYPFVYFQRALTYLKMKDTAAVLADYNTVLKLDSLNALTYYNRALIKAAQKQWDKAISDIDKTLSMNPENIYAWFNRGAVHMEMKKYREAEADFTKTVTLFPDFAGGYINRAFAREKLGKQKEAYSDRQRAQNIINLANKEKNDIKLLYKRYSDSIYFSKIIRFTGDFLSGDMKKGRVQFSRINIVPKPDIYVLLLNDNEYSGAEDKRGYYFDNNIIRFNADNVLGIKLVFSTAVDSYRKNFTAAAERKNINIIKSGDTAGYCFIKGIIMTIMQNNTKAIECYDSTLIYNKTFAYALLNRGAALYEQENYEWQDLKYTSTIGINKTGFNAQTKIKPPDYERSLTDYNNLITLYPSLPYVYYNRANLKTGLRKFQRAIDDYSMAIKLNPQFAEAYFNRALVLLYLKENKLACKDLSKAGELGIKEAYNIIKRYCGK